MKKTYDKKVFSRKLPFKRITVGMTTRLVMALLLGCPLLASAGSRDSIPDYPIKGKVLDEKGKPLPGVTILLDSTRIGTVTGIDGAFSLGYPRQKEHWRSLLSGMKMPRRTS
ncbi:MAG: carboxypeptidase-like regulatory domain-containing protein [Butyricimonas faecihominis]